MSILYLAFILPNGYIQDNCIFNPFRWFVLSLTNFYTANLVFYFILTLLPLPRRNVRFALTLFLYFVLLPFLTLYAIYGSIVIKQPETQQAKAVGNKCVSDLISHQCLVHDDLDQDLPHSYAHLERMRGIYNVGHRPQNLPACSLHTQSGA